ncbi:hypothetical protein [Amphritea pacifica]|uniref:Uncharacterized protein n=1 Tax=Amphritea pacifica TaxID=2811233 RepID=A0ABS2WCG4_9GAMM|nr:hypothetical protein [Amphritea pacifica]MBN0989401.1 hypothetical protein [Amphritea pacifica]MBN1008495.1 hypothetical protein [Amphritea pacifica]
MNYVSNNCSTLHSHTTPISFYHLLNLLSLSDKRTATDQETDDYNFYSLPQYKLANTDKTGSIIAVIKTNSLSAIGDPGFHDRSNHSPPEYFGYPGVVNERK